MRDGKSSMPPSFPEMGLPGRVLGGSYKLDLPSAAPPPPPPAPARRARGGPPPPPPPRPAGNCLPVLDQVGPFLGRKGVLNFFHPAFETTKKKLQPPFLTANAGGLGVSSHKHINISSAEKCRQLQIWKFQECHEFLHRSIGFLTVLAG
jgi:hypothetical protein